MTDDWSYLLRKKEEKDTTSHERGQEKIAG